MKIEKGKRVLLRADLNVPLHIKKIIDDHKLQAILPTIDIIQNAGGKVILITHLGRPTLQQAQDEQKRDKFSTKNLIPWFEKRGYSVVFEPNLRKAKEKSFQDLKSIVLLDNIRFFKEEKTQDPKFAKSLSELGDYFVNDAFGSIHKMDTSISLLPKMFDKNKRFLGPLIKNEIKKLNKILKNPVQPFVLIIGGAKVGTKIALLEKLLDKVQIVLLCPAIVFTFSKYLGKTVGKSLVDEKSLELVPKILKKTKKLGIKVLFPLDYLVAESSFDGPVKYVDSQNIPENCVGLSIGTKTAKYFGKEILKGKTIFFNGAFGNMKKKETLEGLKKIFDYMAKSKAYTIIGGGDSVACAHLLGVSDSIDYLSTGGGAVLAYLSGTQMPGLKNFE